MIRATLDVNVLVSGFQGKPGVPKALVDAWVNLAYELVLSEHIIEGLVRAWDKPYFRQRVAPGAVQQILALLRTEALVVVPNVPVHGIGEDEEDDLVLSTALTGAAAYLVTGDRHLQQIGGYQGLIILPPREFLEVLARSET